MKKLVEQGMLSNGFELGHLTELHVSQYQDSLEKRKK